MAENEFTMALFSAQRDWDRDGVIYIDPKIHSDTIIATKVRLGLELSGGVISIRLTRCSANGEKASYDNLIRNGEI